MLEWARKHVGSLVARTRALPNSQFIRYNFTYFAGTLIFGAISYAYYPIIGRLMPPSSFGEVQTLITIFLQYTIFLNVLDLVVINVLVSYKESAQARKMVLELEKLATLVGFGILLITVASSSELQSFLQFSSPWPFVLVGVAGVVSIPFIFRSGYLQAEKCFGLVTGANVISATGRLVFGAGLVLAGFATMGAMWGLVVAQILALGFAAAYARRHGFRESVSMHNLPNLRMLLPELKYAGLALTGSITVTLLYSVDILVVKHYFDAQTAGLYAAISITARILFFLTASIAQVLIPSVSRQRTSQQNQEVLTKSLGLLVLIGGLGLLVFNLAPRFVIRASLGATYLAYADLLPRLSIAIFFVSLINLLVIYHTALRHYSVAVVAICGSVITLALMLMRHDTLGSVVNDLIVGSTCTLGMLLILTITDIARLNGTKHPD